MTVENGWSFIAVPSMTIDPISINEVANNSKMSSFHSLSGGIAVAIVEDCSRAK